MAADSFTASRGFGIYAVDTLKLNDYFDIIGGIRWDYFSTGFDDKRNVAAAIDFNNINSMFSYRRAGFQADPFAELLFFLRHFF